MSQLSKVTNGLLFDDDFSEQTLLWSLSPSSAAMNDVLDFSGTGLRLKHTEQYITYTMTEPDRDEYSCVVHFNHIPYDETDLTGVIVIGEKTEQYAECQSYVGLEDEGDIVADNMVTVFENNEPYAFDKHHAVMTYEDDEVSPNQNFAHLTLYYEDDQKFSDFFRFGDYSVILYHWIKFNKVGDKFSFWASTDSYNWIEVGSCKFDHTHRLGMFLYGTTSYELTKLISVTKKEIKNSELFNNQELQQINMIDFFDSANIVGSGWRKVEESNTFIETVNTDGYEKVISRDFVEAFVERIALRSTDGDDDMIGIVLCNLGADENPYGVEMEIALLVQNGGINLGNAGWSRPNANSTAALVLNYGTNWSKILSEVTLRTGGSSIGWNSIAGVSIFANRSGSGIKAWLQYNSYTTWATTAPPEDMSPTLEYVFNEGDFTDIFIDAPVHYGFGTHSQANSYFTSFTAASMSFQSAEYTTVEVSPNTNVRFGRFTLYEDRYITINNIDPAHEIEIYDEDGQILLRTDDVAYAYIHNRSRHLKQEMVNVTTLPQPIRGGTIRIYPHDDYTTTIDTFEMSKESWGGDIYELSRDIRIFHDLEEVNILEMYDLGLIARETQYLVFFVMNNEEYVMTDVSISVKAYSEYYNGHRSIRLAKDGRMNDTVPLDSLYYEKTITYDTLYPGQKERFFMKLDDKPLLDFYNASHDYRFKIVVE